MNFTKLKKYCEIITLLDDIEKDTELYFALLGALKNLIDKELQVREFETMSDTIGAYEDIICFDN